MRIFVSFGSGMMFLAVIQMFQISTKRWGCRGIKLVWPSMLALMLQYEDKLKVRKCKTTSMHPRRWARLFVDFERRSNL